MNFPTVNINDETRLAALNAAQEPQGFFQKIASRMSGRTGAINDENAAVNRLVQMHNLNVGQANKATSDETARQLLAARLAFANATRMVPSDPNLANIQTGNLPPEILDLLKAGQTNMKGSLDAETQTFPSTANRNIAENELATNKFLGGIVPIDELRQTARAQNRMGTLIQNGSSIFGMDENNILSPRAQSSLPTETQIEGQPFYDENGNIIGRGPGTTVRGNSLPQTFNNKTILDYSNGILAQKRDNQFTPEFMMPGGSQFLTDSALSNNNSGNPAPAATNPARNSASGINPEISTPQLVGPLAEIARGSGQTFGRAGQILGATVDAPAQYLNNLRKMLIRSPQEQFSTADDLMFSKLWKEWSAPGEVNVSPGALPLPALGTGQQPQLSLPTNQQALTPAQRAAQASGGYKGQPPTVLTPAQRARLEEMRALGLIK